MTTAFGELYDRYQDRVYRYVLSVVGRSGHEDDVFQEVFVALYKQLGASTEIRRLESYLFAIARTKCIDHLRQRKRGAATLDARDPEHAVDLPDPVDSVQEQLLRDDFSRYLALLPEHQQSAVHLRDVEGLSYKRIAEVLEVPPGTVRTLIHRGRAHIYRELRRRYGR